MNRTVCNALVCALAVLVLMPAYGAELETTIDHFQRLSIDLRGRRLDDEERRAIKGALESEPEATYNAYVQEWLTKDALKRFVNTFLRTGSLFLGVRPDAEVFFHRLEKNEDTYFLPHLGRCDPDSAVTVDVWWQAAPVRVCAQSYRPEKIFDEMGYCSGEAEPFMRQPPRAECGCGPMLMGCLPPVAEHPSLDDLVRTSVMDEWEETTARIVAEDQPLDDVLTTSRSWQTGLTEFLYLRRELVGLLNTEAWSDEIDGRIAERVSKIAVYARGRWVERSGIYEGAGLWWSGMTMHALKAPVRGAAHHFLFRHLCSQFNAVNVDADAILKAVGSEHENLRTLSSILEAPMRTQTGCKGCHAPMDGAVGFMTELQAPMYGSHPSGLPGEGEFYVTGARDFRGKGNGMAMLAKLAVSQPEFETCSVRRAFEEVLVRPLKSYDVDLFEELVAQFRANGHRWVPILKALLRSNAYKNPARHGETTVSAPASTDAVPDAVPDAVTGVMRQSCMACHNDTHPLDFTEIPPPTNVALWERVLVRVSDYSMPPPSHGDSIEERFPLDPSLRTAFIASLQEMLAASLDRAEEPRRLDHNVWRKVVQGMAAPSIGVDRVAALLEPALATGAYFAALAPRGRPPTYQLAVERASEAVCRKLPKVRPPSVPELLERVYGDVPTESEVTVSDELLERFRQVTDDPDEAGWRSARPISRALASFSAST